MRKQISENSSLQPLLQPSMIQKQSSNSPQVEKKLFQKIERNEKNQTRYFGRTLAWEKNVNQLEFE